MSLIQRVTSIEGVDRQLPAAWEDSEHAHSQLHSAQNHPQPHLFYDTFDGHAASFSRRRSHKSLRAVLSYDALPKPADVSHSTDPVGGVAPYKISTTRRLAQVLATVLSCWLASGIVFGFAALKPVLVDQGVYRDQCTRQELEEGVEVCYQQGLRLNVFFALASTTCNVSALAVGTILDRYGARVAISIGSLFLAAGSLLMALAFQIPAFDGYLTANVFLALGGTFVFVPSFSIANAFPKFSGTIVATVTGAFDASAAVFLIYRLMYEANKHFTPHRFFYAYLAVPALVFLLQIFLMTPDGYKTVPQLEQKLEQIENASQDVHDSDEDLSERELRKVRTIRRERRESKLQDLDSVLGDAEFREARAAKQDERLVNSGVWGALHGKPVLEQLTSPWFILITLLTVLQMLRMNFFIATIRSQYEYMLGSEQLARRVNALFDIALPVGGVATTPFIGLLLDNLSTANMLAVLVALTTACGLFGSLPYLWAAYVNVILFVVLRPLYYSAMSDYTSKVFGYASFGRVYGMIICLSGMVNLGQPMLDAINHDVFHDNPIPINILLATLGLVIGVMLVGFVRVKATQPTTTTTTMMSALRGERQHLIPGSILEDESEFDESF